MGIERALRWAGRSCCPPFSGYQRYPFTIAKHGFSTFMASASHREGAKVCEGLVYISDLPVVHLDPTGTTLEYTSGNATYRRRYPRHLWRAFLEREIRRLNEFEVAERCEVVPIKSKRRAH